MSRKNYGFFLKHSSEKNCEEDLKPMKFTLKKHFVKQNML